MSHLRNNNPCSPNKILAFILLILFAEVALARFQDAVPSPAAYKSTKLPVDERVHDLLDRMTLDEKVSMLSGAVWMETVAIPRLGIPAIKMADGPMGIRSWHGPSAITSSEEHHFNSTAFPAGIAVAATWDPAIAQAVGQALAQEMRAIGRDMILGPTVNIQRVPLWGRNFEGYGEDPYLAARMGVAYIKGVQGEGIIATIKHFAANNQEFERHRVDESIDERTLQEIYFPAFKAAVKEADVWSVMSAYQKVNGNYCSANSFLLKGILKNDWGYQGFVVSDWGSTYSTANTVNAGMDLEMPGGEPARFWLSTPLAKEVGNGGDWLAPRKVLAEVSAGNISAATIDDNVGRILHTMFVSGVFDRTPGETGNIDTPSQRAVARQGEQEAIVLLKNEGSVLPLDRSKIQSIAVIGPSAAVARTGGGGSSLVRPNYVVTPLDGIKEKVGSPVTIDYALGVGMPGEDPARETPEGRDQLRKEAVDLAAKDDVVILMIGDSAKVESEDFDRTTLDLPEGQDDLVQAIAKANRRTIVVFNAGAPVNVSRWVNQVPAVLDAWFGGQEIGHAIADVLFGDVNPSGKLPFSFINDFKESPASGNYPGKDLHVTYAEGIYVGYRYFDKHNMAPQFPFGYGLSYTNFGYSTLKITPDAKASGPTYEVSLTLRNEGKRAGAEVVQLYIHDGHSKIDRPVKELKGFRRVELAPGKSTTVSFTLDESSMAYYSTQKKQWVADPGTFDVLIGSSSADIRLKGSFELTH
ncbi:MAG: glycoside hydrolase family 3 C-terminal domain-containing protein [Candidatus Acidiferrales bacterium]